ncbi:enoyl-[acyl-carrier-protein] reductase FabV [Vibrio sp. CAIM 722]|uniref:Enoyl-[acyl-carrier-protein] reductase [NADH] n=1 Tax=Vibrio eleionomae TaxID=2653505 RepID=A0A7X4LNI0_9VIBR|nr:enoyl-ACP reductase FabV [Vibrio eleionomae]MZI95164.1 enoyl-[acyl-carrier-protein] reductase FabV [Vibrio eleionomae]
MHIEPVIKSVVAKTAHPLGCEQAVLQQIEYVKTAKPITKGPKRVLILGASSGYGLAARIALTFGGAEADTIGVSLERNPTESQSGSAGFYNNFYFKQQAEKAGRIAVNLQGDVFSQDMKDQVIEAIETYFEGEVDLIIYSIASSKRRQPDNEKFWRSYIKPIGDAVAGSTVVLENDAWSNLQLEPATNEELSSTIKVMGGEDWENWIDALINVDSIAQGCKTIAFSYMGPEITHPIYLDGTLGQAKIDLHQTSHALNLKLANYDGGAFATVCKAIVTKASMVIPGLSPYMTALYKVMKAEGTHETGIQQMQRLFSEKLFLDTVPVDGERLIRMDDHELSEQTQTAVNTLLAQMNEANFAQIGDYAGFKQEFMHLNGFGFDNVDYAQDVDLSIYKKDNEWA